MNKRASRICSHDRVRLAVTLTGIVFAGNRIRGRAPATFVNDDYRARVEFAEAHLFDRV